MKWSTSLCAIGAVIAQCLLFPSTGRVAATPISPENANHVFNAIHSATRQWGSSLQHNGFSFYLATVPRNTRLYHGRHDNGPMRGIDWFAFEPEHALLFSLPFVQSPPGGVYPDPDPDPDNGVPVTWPSRDGIRYGAYLQKPLPRSVPSLLTHPVNDEKKGFLHTYKPQKDLRMLYIDGMSGAKVDKGTMDSQDHVLLNITETPDISYDGIRARELCKLIREEWQSDLDGIIRMEAGFEAIICSIEDSLQVERVQESLAVPSFGELNLATTYLNAVRAVSRAYHGYVDGRIILDPDSLVTGYMHLRKSVGKEEMLRLLNVSNASRAKIHREVKHMVLDGPARGQRTGINWQKVADNIIRRYATNLQYLLDPSIVRDADSLLRELEHLLNPYVDNSHRNATAEAARCAEDELPPRYEISISAQATSYISRRICTTLATSAFELYDVQAGSPPQKDLARASVAERIQSLVDYLQWPIWKDCGGCPIDRVCLVAMFPFGNQEDHDHPSCLNATQLLGRNGYWLDWKYLQ